MFDQLTNHFTLLVALALMAVVVILLLRAPKLPKGVAELLLAFGWGMGLLHNFGLFPDFGRG